MNFNFKKCGQKRIKAAEISKEDVIFYHKVTSCGKTSLKEHNFF